MNNSSYKVKDAVSVNECEAIAKHIVNLREETNISDDCFKQVRKYLSKLENDEKRAEALQSFASNLETRIEMRQHVNFGFGAESNVLIEDLCIAFNSVFQVDIKNFNALYKDSSGWTRQNKYTTSHLIHFKPVNAENAIVCGVHPNNNDNILYKWKGYNIATHTKELVSDEFRLKFKKALAPLFNNCMDKTYPLKERINVAVDPFRMQAKDKINDKQITDISNTRIIDGLLNNIQHKYWIPTLIKIDNDYKCTVVSEILNLSLLQYGDIYKYIEYVFGKMVKQFEWILKCQLNNKTIQAIIEIQHYEIAGNTTFNGNFHREGLRYLESIAAGGVWYFDKSPDVFVSDKFEIQANGYVVCGGQHSDNYVIDVNVNDNIIFNNNIVIHRLLELVNNTSNIGKRSHLLFLLPEYKIKSTYDIIQHNKMPINQYQVMDHVINYMIRNIKNLGVEKIPNEIKQLLSSYCHTNLQEMIAFRNKLRLKRVYERTYDGNNILLASIN